MTFRASRHRADRIHEQRRARTYSSMANWVRLASSGWYLFLDDVLGDADIAALVGADSCWQFAVDDWRRRRPSRWRWSARRAWRDEERELAREQARLVGASAPLRTLRPFAGCD